MAEQETQNETPPVEVRAKEMGWIPKEEFKGDESKWIDAETFVERGETLLPIIKANNRDLSQKLSQTQQQLAQAAAAIAEQRETIEGLKQFNEEIALQRAKQRKAEIPQEIKEAREAEDVEREEELRAELGEVNEQLKPKAPARQQNGNGNQPPPQVHPIVQAWVKDNPWFGQDEDRTNLANAVATSMRRKPEFAALVGKREFLDAVSAKVEELMPTSRRPSHDRVEGGARGSASTSSSGGKSYSDLPKEAKEACEAQAKRLVGANRAFKDINAWRAHYCSIYFKE